MPFYSTHNIANPHTISYTRRTFFHEHLTTAAFSWQNHLQQKQQKISVISIHVSLEDVLLLMVMQPANVIAYARLSTHQSVEQTMKHTPIFVSWIVELAKWRNTLKYNTLGNVVQVSSTDRGLLNCTAIPHTVLIITQYCCTELIRDRYHLASGRNS